MDKKVISVFLFTLFCIVIAFPGYGRGNTVVLKSKVTQLCASSTHELTMEGLMKKCLACGISVVEEERPVEESQSETEDGLTNTFEDFIVVLAPFSIMATDKYKHITNHLIDYGTIHLRAIPTPPPEC
jgi:hypothetical protein